MNKHKDSHHRKHEEDHHGKSSDNQTVPDQNPGNGSGSQSAPVGSSEIEKLKDQLLRKAAEFENYKKRKDTEQGEFLKYASEKVISELLPVYDDLQRSIDSIEKGETKDFESLKKGIGMIFEKFKAVMQREGVTEINTVGKPFDFHLSDAVMQIPRDDVKPNTVIESFEKGYKLKDKVIRHEKVMVSSEPE